MPPPHPLLLTPPPVDDAFALSTKRGRVLLVLDDKDSDMDEAMESDGEEAPMETAAEPSQTDPPEQSFSEAFIASSYSLHPFDPSYCRSWI